MFCWIIRANNYIRIAKIDLKNKKQLINITQMKKITRICSTLFIGGMMLVSANSFAKGTKGTDKNQVTENAAVTGANFCSVFATVIRQTNNTCYGQANGNVVVYASFGAQPYSYSWSPAVSSSLPLDTIDIVGGMTAGTYTCTVTDANGCTYALPVKITAPTKITVANGSVTNETCYGETMGSFSISASGGTPNKIAPGYSYAWTPNVTTTTSASSLAAGTYIVTVTDSNRCTTKDTVKITQPVQITTTSAMVPSSCITADGSASAAASSGVTPYTYSWAPGGVTTDTIKNIGVGSYTCTITDAHGCNVKPIVIVKDSTTLTAVTRTQADEKCYGYNNGFAAIKVTGGLGKAITYGWAPFGGTDTVVSGLTSGTYTFTATDSVGCKAVDLVTITQPSQIRDSMSGVRNVTCFGAATGRTTDGVAGGTSPYTYAWSTGATTSGITGVTAGTYSVMLTDANGCKDSAKITLTQPATAVADSNKVGKIACYGGAASLTVDAFGGVKPYTYAWSGGSTNTTNSATGLASGTYIVSIRDSNKCRLRDTVVITQPPSFIIANDTSLSFPCSNKAAVQVVGTISKYTFSWAPTGGTHDTATGLCATGYTVTITDSTGCVEHDTINIFDPNGIQQYNNPQDIKVYPVPARDQINISITGTNFAPQYIGVYDVTGRLLLTEKATATQSLYTINVSKLTEGTYFIKLSGNGERIVKFTVAGK